MPGPACQSFGGLCPTAAGWSQCCVASVVDDETEACRMPFQESMPGNWVARQHAEPTAANAMVDSVPLTFASYDSGETCAAH